MGQNLRKGVDQCKPDFNMIWERQGAVVYKRNSVDIFCCVSTMDECDRQTHHGTVILIAIGDVSDK